ncbi:iron(III) transport system substrate-binding protein [Sphaerotilus sulfidivorans]|uniref:Extracellular solute-binding protein n=1 Tax=Sphaerotilus sulfidivorans TaxID=639200 RepID=A0A5C1Q4D9_9BURK|nr:extracellular solute-binding protein [Sphaerotilus sulfidivorans]NZD46693.1 extracellular solute-binding protein [Sphaerotilus sulfidivorans]QEN00962.1 extracellular solute-binding protein [Sphaerotilus sulfidivorans]
MTAKNTLKTLAGLISCLGALAATPALAQEQVLNLYSARHYQTDEALFSNFTKATGIKINIVSADDAGILQRLKSEGAASPADVILLVDAARLWFAQTNDLFAPVKSSYLEQRIPAQLRGKDAGQGSEWFGYSTRARVVVYNKLKVKREDVDSYAKLADPKLKGQFCSRSGSHPYNLSLFGSYLEHAGPAATEAWLKGLVANQARDPKGGDTDQIKATASGECGVALSNTYYIARMMRSNKPDERAAMEQVGVVFPNQQSWGTHVNVAGGAMARHARNRVAAVKFLEYLATDEAQRYFADGNNEYPAVSTVKISNPALDTLGPFKQELIPLSAVGQNTPKVQQMLDRAGYK